MAIQLRSAEEEEAFVLHVRQNMVRRNLPPPFPSVLRGQRGLRTDEGAFLPDFDRAVPPGVNGVISGPLADCLGSGGETIYLDRSVLTGATVVQASREISRPFLITHIFAYATHGVDTASQFAIKVAGDNDTSGGFNTTGNPVVTDGGLVAQFDVGDRPVHMYPNFMTALPRQFIKAIFFNSTAGTVTFALWVSVIKF